MLRALSISAWLGVAAASASAAGHTQARLVLANEMVLPGDAALAGIELHMDPQWHTFWKNPGASGIPTSIQWEQSWRVTAGPIQWPVPEKLTVSNLTSYGYRNDVILLVPVKIAYGVPPGSLDLKATVSWLECKDKECIPVSVEVQAALGVGRQIRPSADAELLRRWQAKLPQSGATLSAHAWWEGPATSDRRPLILEWNSPRVVGEADFFPYASEGFEVQSATERMPSKPGKIRLRKQVKKLSGNWPGQVSGLLIERTAKKRFGFDVMLPIPKLPESGVAVTGSPDANHGDTTR